MTRRTIPDPLRIAQTASAGVGTWADRAAAYSQWLPGYPQSARSYLELPPELRGYIKDRAAAYGMDPVEVFRKVPRALSEDPDAVESFLRGHEISHVYPTSTHPELEADPANWTFEVGEINGSRQATVMTPEEWHEAQESAHVWASWRTRVLLRAHAVPSTYIAAREPPYVGFSGGKRLSKFTPAGLEAGTP